MTIRMWIKDKPCGGRLNVNSVSYKNVRGYLQTGKRGQTPSLEWAGIWGILGDKKSVKTSSSW